MKCEPERTASSSTPSSWGPARRTPPTTTPGATTPSARRSSTWCWTGLGSWPTSAPASRVSSSSTPLAAAPDPVSLKLPSLTKLDISENRLSKGLEVLKDCPSLKFLSVNDNKFKELSTLEPLKALSKLTHLDIQGNEFEGADPRSAVFDMLPQVQFLDGKDREGKDDEDSNDDDDVEEGEEEEDDDEEDESSGEEDDGPGLSALYGNTADLDDEEGDGDYDETGDQEDDDDDVEDEEDEEEESRE